MSHINADHANPSTQQNSDQRRPSWDVFILFILVLATMQILAFGEATIPQDMRLNDVLRHPFLGNLLPAQGEELLSGNGPRPAEPLGLVLQALSLGFLILYAVVDLGVKGERQLRLKWFTLAALILTVLYLPTLKLVLLRQITSPAAYAHDGGVIQTESTIQFLLEGKNPYREDYLETPMREWGFDEYRTALYHYPYLPWTFIFSAPFYLIGTTLGLYDQRLVYLMLLTIMLWVAPTLVTSSRTRLVLVAALALNPLMALDVVFGQNDVFVLSWIVFSLVCWRRSQQMEVKKGDSISTKRWRIYAMILFGLACASKPTAWFFAPFYGLLLIQEQLDSTSTTWRTLIHKIPQIIARAAPALGIFALLLLPYILWDPFAFYDDVWRWSNGQGETGYQIWGWGASNFVLALGLVESRFSLWPFWILELLIALPLFVWFIQRQMRQNTLSLACWHYGIALLTFFYTSRFLNENYLAYILAFIAIGYLGEEPD
ncbi:MAG: hypothetical protein AAF702_28260 [Chloroflexota bacterium]